MSDAEPGLAIAEPDIPWLAAGEPPVARPVFACPAGWREVHPVEDDLVVTTCDPWPETGRATCTAVAEEHFPGEPGCARIGPACPTGDWAEDLPAGRPIRYVKAGAPAGGDGSMAMPFALISDATTGAAAGTVIALAKGHYDEPVRLDAGVTLWGACVAETVLTAAAGTAGAVVVTHGAGAELRNVRIADAGLWGIAAAGAARTLTIDSVVIDGATIAGLDVRDRAAVSARSLVVRNTRALGTADNDIFVGSGASLELSRAVLDADLPALVVRGDGTTAHVADVAIAAGSGAGPTAVPAYARIDVDSGAHATFARLDLAVAADSRGVFAGFSTVEITDMRVEGGLSGIWVEGAAGARTVHVSQLWIDAAARHVYVASSAPTLDDVVSTDAHTVGTTPGLGFGCGSPDSMASPTVRRMVVARSGSHSFGAVGMCDAVLEDVEAIDPPSGAALMTSFLAFDGAQVEVTRAIARRRPGFGFGAVGTGSRMRATDVLLTEGVPHSECGTIGMIAVSGGTLELSRAVIDHAQQMALAASEGTVHASDVIIRDVTGCGTGRHGRGVGAELGGALDATRIRVERAREVAVWAGLAGSSVTLSDLTVADTLAQECATTTCADRSGGTAIIAADGASLHAMRFRVTGAALCGVHVANTGSALDLVSGEVRGAAIGACVQSDGYDVARLTTGVSYFDNGVNLQATTLPLPESLGMLAP